MRGLGHEEQRQHRPSRPQASRGRRAQGRCHCGQGCGQPCGPAQGRRCEVTRRAIVKTTRGNVVAAYLPSNYSVVGATPEGWTIVEGKDVAGWTLDGYVIPRLASGLYFA